MYWRERCVEGECRCGLQDEADWTNPGCTNGADCDQQLEDARRQKTRPPYWRTAATLAIRLNGTPILTTRLVTLRVTKIMGVRLCRGNETGAKVGWAECNGEYYIMEECAADELCTEDWVVKTCAAEAIVVIADRVRM